jgi:ABC-type sugar transport system substrate-binding protein
VNIVEEWMKEGLPVLAVSVESSHRLTPALEAARAEGIKVPTWDSDAEAEAREESARKDIRITAVSLPALDAATS